MRAFLTGLFLGAVFLAESLPATAQVRLLDAHVGAVNARTVATPAFDFDTVSWRPAVEMDGQLFPAYVLATATAKLYDPKDEDPHWLGDQNGMIGVRIANPGSRTRVRLEVNLPRLTEGLSVYEGFLDEAGTEYFVFPHLNYDYDLLPQLLQPRPATATFTLYLNGQRVGQQTKTFQVRAITDCPYAFTNLFGEDEDVSWMFAGYVNENHPDVDVLLGEALGTGLVSAIDGYQTGNPDDVYKQVFALWTALHQRGLRYSSGTRPSGGDQNVLSQTVRPMGQALRLSQANCVDGTVLMASVLRRIELDPFLILVPGHCFLGFYLDKAHKTFDVLETTLLGEPVKGTSSRKLAKVYGQWFGNNPRHLASWKAFSAAIDDANATYDEYKKKLEDENNPDLSCQIIDVDECRKTGVMPISQPLRIPALQISPATATNHTAEKPDAVASQPE